MPQTPKLELTWIGKENRLKLEPRILLEDSEKSYHTLNRVTTHTLHTLRNGGKPWKYVLIPRDVIAENMTLAGLVGRFSFA